MRGAPDQVSSRACKRGTLTCSNVAQVLLWGAVVCAVLRPGGASSVFGGGGAAGWALWIGGPGFCAIQRPMPYGVQAPECAGACWRFLCAYAADGAVHLNVYEWPASQAVLNARQVVCKFITFVSPAHTRSTWRKSAMDVQDGSALAPGPLHVLHTGYCKVVGVPSVARVAARDVERRAVPPATLQMAVDFSAACKHRQKPVKSSAAHDICADGQDKEGGAMPHFLAAAQRCRVRVSQTQGGA